MSVFIGIPTFNRPELVLATIESVRRQTFGDYRVVVSDNCSNGDVGDRIRRYVEGLNDLRFTFHQQAYNGGEYGQGRYFLRASEGARYLMILHDDDLLAPDFLRRAVSVLDEQEDVSLFVSNCWVVDHDGQMAAEETRKYLADHGRCGRPAGPFDVLGGHLTTGFTPISGTLFRRRALLRSGFADPDGTGNFPFECDVFLRLGDIGAIGWFTPSQLMSIRYHDGSLRRTLKLMDNPAVVRPMLKLFEKRRYSGWRERRRRIVLSRLQRADALIRLRQGDLKVARRLLAKACYSNLLSLNGWYARLLAWVSPRRLLASLPPLPAAPAPVVAEPRAIEAKDAPRVVSEEIFA